MREHFQRFDPATMVAEEYLDYTQFREPNFDLKVVSVLGGAFNPVLEAFHARSQALIAEGTLDGLKLSGRKPQRKRYTVNQVDEMDPSLLVKHQTGQMLTYIISEQRNTDRGSLNLIAPVGDYGEEFASANIAAGRALYSLADKTIAGDCAALRERYSKVLSLDTFQKNPYYSFLEGIQTTTAMISILTADKVEGYEDDPLRLSQDIVRDGLIQWFGASSPNGMIFPMARSGYYFPDTVVPVDGKLTISEQTKRRINDERIEDHKYSDYERRARGCPVAHKTIEVFSEDTQKKVSGLDLLTGLYVDVLEYFVNEGNGHKPKI